MSRKKADEEKPLRRFLTCKEVAEDLRVQPVTIRQWIHRGLIPHYKLGKGRSTILFEREEYQKWLDAKRRYQRRLNFE